MALKDITNKEFKKSRSFKDIGVSFSKNSFTDDLAIVKNENSIKQSVKNLILTQMGEKPFQPTKGCRVNALLFEPLDPFTADALKEEVLNTIRQYEPRVKISDCVVTPILESNKINISITYRVVGLPIVETIAFILQRPE
tara:strand:- start:12179 stop:12598 length:420 start_codon:yes stop_codon:yes gene_type:complete